MTPKNKNGQGSIIVFLAPVRKCSRTRISLSRGGSIALSPIAGASPSTRSAKEMLASSSTTPGSSGAKICGRGRRRYGAFPVLPNAVMLMFDHFQIYHPTPQDSKKEKFVVELKDITERHVILRQGGPDVVKAGLVVQNRTLTAPGFTPESRHMGKSSGSSCLPTNPNSVYS